ncbi:MAG: ribbon-helix-helix protein, CopG family [Dehalococcoidia bacterium]|nr:ribbon-helix-helix protein, CopG family [Dehalococcoidia bacterium]
MAKVLVSIDDELLALIDARARAKQLSRSAYLRMLAEREVLPQQSEERRARIQRVLDELREMGKRNGTGEGSVTDQIREMRDSR